MPTTAPSLAAPAVPAATPTATAIWRRLRAGLRRLGSPVPLDPDAAHLREAVDLADLETRLRRLERGRPDRFGPLPP